PETTLDPNQCLVFFLTGGSVTGRTGFAVDPGKPFAKPAVKGETRRGPFVEFDPKKYDKDGRLLDPWGTPYAYFSAVKGNDYGGKFQGVTPYRGAGEPVKYFAPKTFQL